MVQCCAEKWFLIYGLISNFTGIIITFTFPIYIIVIFAIRCFHPIWIHLFPSCLLYSTLLSCFVFLTTGRLYYIRRLHGPDGIELNSIELACFIRSQHLAKYHILSYPISSNTTACLRCELLDEEMVRIVNSSNPDMPPWPEHTLLLYELTGEREREIGVERDRKTE